MRRVACELSRKKDGRDGTKTTRAKLLTFFFCLFFRFLPKYFQKGQRQFDSGDMFKKSKSKVLVDYASEEDDMSWHHHHSYKVKMRQMEKKRRHFLLTTTVRCVRFQVFPTSWKKKQKLAKSSFATPLKWIVQQFSLVSVFYLFIF